MIEGRNGYFSRFKELYSAEEWPPALEKLVNELSTQGFATMAYIEIILEGKLWGRLLDFCNRQNSYISDYYTYLKEDYEDEAKDIYNRYILQEAKRSSNRNQYKAVCRKIKEFRKVVGPEEADQLIAHLQNAYKKRPAFLDELSRV